MSVKEHLKSYILSKSISSEERKLGIEVECFIFDKNNNRIAVNRGSSFSASDLLKELNVKITRLARGLPAGSDIAYADSATIAAALNGRTSLE